MDYAWELSMGSQCMAKTTNLMKKKKWTKNDTQLLTLALPTTVWYAVFCYLPMVGALIAFKQFMPASGFIKSLLTSRWVGLENFFFLFGNRLVWGAIRNTLLYNLALISLGLFLPVTLAIIASELWNKKLAKLYQTLMFFPYFLSWVVVSALVMAFFSYDMGILNRIFEFFGEEKRFWYREVSMWPPFLVFLSQWKSIGHGMIIYLATITSLDKTIYEAAIIDGATKWQQIRKITLPLIKNMIVLFFILSTGSIFSSDFGLFYLIPRQTTELYEVTNTINVFVYNQLLSSTIGMASASALLQSVASCIMILLVNQIVRRIDSDAAMI
jgi:putative aldouronate transport system permease protein